MKMCSLCKETKDIDQFGKHKGTKDKLQYCCKDCGNQRGREYRQQHPERTKAANAKTVARLGKEYYRQQNLQLKKKVIDAYGGKCACCDEAELTFLSLDHVSGGGRKHRTAVGGGVKLWRILRDAGWPKELPEVGRFRVLCMNCQFGYLHGRTCPHELKRQAAMVCVDPDTPS